MKLPTPRYIGRSLLIGVALGVAMFSVVSALIAWRLSSITSPRLVDATPESAAGPALASTPPPPRDNQPAAIVLDILASRETVGAGTRRIEGTVRNISDRPLHDLRAVTHWSNASGQIVLIGEAPIDTSVLVPGQTAAFHTATPTSEQTVVKHVTFFKETDEGAGLITRQAGTKAGDGRESATGSGGR